MASRDLNKSPGHSNELVMQHILETLRHSRFTGQIVLHVNSSVIRKYERIDAEAIKARRQLVAGDMVTTASLLTDRHDPL